IESMTGPDVSVKLQRWMIVARAGETNKARQNAQTAPVNGTRLVVFIGFKTSRRPQTLTRQLYPRLERGTRYLDPLSCHEWSSLPSIFPIKYGAGAFLMWHRGGRLISPSHLSAP